MQQRFFIKIYDKILSIFYPYVWRSLDLQYTPSHIFLTGGLIPTKKQEKYFKNLAKLITMAYDNGVSQVTLHLPYALWGYMNISTLTTDLNIQFKKLNYRPFISFVSNEADQLIIDNTDVDCEILQGKSVTILILGPNAKRSDLSSSQLIIQLMDQRHSRNSFVQQFKDADNPDMKIFQNLYGLQQDSSGMFNKRPELVLIFGGDFNKSVSSLPFWMLREAIIRFCGSLGQFSPNTLARYLYWFDAYRARKFIEIQGN